MFISSTYSQVHWEKTSGPTGGFMRSVVKGPDNKVISGTASMEKPNPVRPCRTAEMKKMNNPIITI